MNDEHARRLEIDQFIFRSALEHPGAACRPLIDVVREVESAWETLRQVRAERGRSGGFDQLGEQLSATALAALTTRSRFIRGTDTTLDTKTGLMWSDTLGDSQTYDEFEKTIAACRSGGFVDWRKPTADELLTIVDRNRHDPAIDVEAFPDTKSSGYWSSSPCAWASGSVVWCVYFHGGGVYDHHRTTYAFARAVRVAGAPARQ